MTEEESVAARFPASQKQLLTIEGGTVQGDACSSAYAINSKGQLIGASSPCDFSVVHTFLWKNGRMIALDRFIPPASGISFTLTDPSSINDRGETVIDGTLNGFMLVPCDEDHADEEGCRDASEDTNAPPQDIQPLTIHSSTLATEGGPTSQMLDGLHARFGRRRWLRRSATDCGPGKPDGH
jgi:probable HAF family extracellular repeat protein